MAIKFRIIQRIIQMGKHKGKTMQVAQALTTKKVSFERLCQEISDGSTVDSADVKAVFDRLVRVVRRHMEDGESVDCGELGTFSPSFGSELVAIGEEFHASQHIRAPRINFRAKPSFKALNEVRFERISKEEEEFRNLSTAKKKNAKAKPGTDNGSSEHTNHDEDSHLGV